MANECVLSIFFFDINPLLGLAQIAFVFFFMVFVGETIVHYTLAHECGFFAFHVSSFLSPDLLRFIILFLVFCVWRRGGGLKWDPQIYLPFRVRQWILHLLLAERGGC